MRKNTTSELRSELAEEFDGELPATVDDAAVRRMRTVAYALDESIRVPGTGFRIGLDPILGVLPGAGDALAGGLSLYIVAEAARLGVTPLTLLRMVANVAIDVAVGSVPWVGDAFDAVWKANKRNFELALSDLALDPDEAGDGEDDGETVPIEVN